MRDQVDSSSDREEISSSVVFSVEEAESRDSRLGKIAKGRESKGQLSSKVLP